MATPKEEEGKDYQEKSQEDGKEEQETSQQQEDTDKGKDEEHKGEEQEDDEGKGEFKTYRKVMFAIGKTLKYAIWASAGFFAYHMYLVKSKDRPEEGFLANDVFLSAAQRADWAMFDLKLLLTRPPVEKLLPDRPPLPPGNAYPKTLVLNLRGTLIHSEYKFGTGFEILKRPGLSVFIQRMARCYELVIFGDEENGIVNDVCEALDPNYSMIAGRLGRESTLLKNGIYVKDLSYLNRPIKDIIYVDFSDEKVQFHQDNCIVLPRWEGDMTDRSLYDIMPFLENLSQAHGSDARSEITKYGKHDTASKFNEMQAARRDMIMRQRSTGMSGLVGNLGKLKDTGSSQQSQNWGATQQLTSKWDK